MPLQTAHAPQGSPLWGWRQLTALAKIFGAGGFACAPHPGEQVGVAHTPGGHLVFQGRHGGTLAHHVLKPLGAAICGRALDTFPHLPGITHKKSGQRCGGRSPALRSSAYGCRLTETHLARRLRLLGSPPDLVRSGPVVQGPHPYAEPRSKALSDLVCSTAQLGAYRYFIIFRFGFQGAFVFPLFYI